MQGFKPIEVAYAQEITIPAPLPVIEKKDPIASNCYAYVRSRIPSLPLAKDIKPNTIPAVGVIAIFDYGPDLPHYGIVSKIEEKGFWLDDTNFGGPGYRTHFISWSDKALVGFRSP